MSFTRPQSFADDAAFWAVFPQRLRSARCAAGLSMARLSRRSGLSLDSVFDWEHGLRQPTVESVIKVARELGVSAA